MNIGFVNNFAQALAADLAAGGSTLTLDGGGALLADASLAKRYRLTLIEKDAEGLEIGYEIIEVTAATGNDLTIWRGFEGTSAQAWLAGTPIEMRLTAGTAGRFVQDDNPIVIGGTFVAATPPAGTVMLGDSGYVTAEGPQVSIGSEVYNYGNRGISIGHDSNAQQDDAVSIGIAVDSDLRGISLGEKRYAYIDAISIGSGEGTAGGAYGEKSVSMGYRNEANNPFSLSFGAGAAANLDGGLLVYGIPYIRLGTPTPLTNQPPASLTVASQAVFALAPLDLTLVGDSVTLGLPDFAAIYIESIEIVVTNDNAATGSPQIKVGTDATSTDNLLAATTVTGLTARHRQKHTPLILDGVDGVRAEVVTAGGGTLNARVIVRCYVLEE